MKNQDKLPIAALAMQGMLAHHTRYKPRPQDAHLHWHDAIAKEAAELAEALGRAFEEDKSDE